jgi:hypothetical protein
MNHLTRKETMKTLTLIAVLLLAVSAFAAQPSQLDLTFDFNPNAPACNGSTVTVSCILNFEAYQQTSTAPNTSTDLFLGTVPLQFSSGTVIRETGIKGTVPAASKLGNQSVYVIACGRDDAGAKLCSSNSNVVAVKVAPRNPTNLDAQAK